MQVKFKSHYVPEGTYNLIGSRYPNNRLALLLRDTDTGEPIGMLTRNLPNNPLRSDEVILKNYSENEGCVEALIEAGIVEKAHRWVMSGYMQLPVCRLTPLGQELEASTDFLGVVRLSA